MSGAGVVGTQIKETFQRAVGTARSQQTPKPQQPKQPKKKRDAPFSLRLSADERAYLKGMAGHRSLGSYMREELLGNMAEDRRALRQPKIDDQQVALLLSELGKSRLYSNLNQLAHHANMGTLDVSPEVEEQLQDAYGAVLAMRELLITALRLKP